jgi:hypothetical protein
VRTRNEPGNEVTRRNRPLRPASTPISTSSSKLKIGVELGETTSGPATRIAGGPKVRIAIIRQKAE